MILQVVVFIFTIGLGSLADATQIEAYKLNSVEMTADVSAEFAKLNRYCGGGGYSYYRPTSYRPSYNSGPNLGSLLGPAVFGLAAVGGASLLAGLLSGVTLGK